MLDIATAQIGIDGLSTGNVPLSGKYEGSTSLVIASKPVGVKCRPCCPCTFEGGLSEGPTLLISDGAGTLAAPVVITRVKFVDGLTAASSGAGVHVTGASTATFVDAKFTNNTIPHHASPHTGGGLHADGGSTVTFVGCTFSGNLAPLGGAFSLGGGAMATVTDCTFHSNAGSGGTGGGAIYLADTASTLAVYGGLFYSNVPGDLASPTAAQVTVSDKVSALPDAASCEECHPLNFTVGGVENRASSSYICGGGSCPNLSAGTGAAVVAAPGIPFALCCFFGGLLRRHSIMQKNKHARVIAECAANPPTR